MLFTRKKEEKKKEMKKTIMEGYKNWSESDLQNDLFLYLSLPSSLSFPLFSKTFSEWVAVRKDHLDDPWTRRVSEEDIRSDP